MKKMFLRVIALVLTICAMQGVFVPSVATAASSETEYARPVTVLDEALTKWEDDRACVANVYGYDYLVLPIYGSKMFIYNLDTQELVDEVDTTIPTPRGIVEKDNVVYVGGNSPNYTVFTYDLETNKTGESCDLRYPENYNSNIAFGSIYDINIGDDGCLYFGTDKGHVLQYDADNNKVYLVYSNSNATTVSAVVQQGDYIYAAMRDGSQHSLVKVKKNADGTFTKITDYDFTETTPGTYLTHMSITEEGIIFGGSTQSLMAVDTTTMQPLDADVFGSGISVGHYVSEKINGKYYFVNRGDSYGARYMYAFDPTTQKATRATKEDSSNWSANGQYLNCHGKTVTLLDSDGVEGEYFIAFTNVPDEIIFTNVKTGEKKNIKGLFEGKGASDVVNSLVSGPAGTNELYYGGFICNNVATYNTSSGKITHKTETSGIQTDAICVDGNYIYAGNYTYGQLTKIKRSTHKKESVLFTLGVAPFYQSRIHSIVAGDGMIFLGTFPGTDKRGGVIAWYDNGRTYVAAGPLSTDVYYSDNASEASPVWYKWMDRDNTNKTAVTSIAIDGVVSQQSIKDVAYYDGILYAATSTYGGTDTTPLAGVSPVIIAYDVSAKQVIATYNFANTDYPASMFAVGGIEVDENGTLWGVAAETLFTLELNASKNGFIYKDHLSINKTNYDETQGRPNSTILFKGDYVYVTFEEEGGICKVSKTDPDDYTNLLPDSKGPNFMAFGEDGNLYYLSGTALKMLALDPTEDEWTVPRQVTAQINTITGVTTPDEIVQIREAYDALTLRQKSLVQNYAVLEQAEVDVLNRAIAALGDIDNITLADYELVQTLMTTCRSMSKSQRKNVTNRYILVQANQKLQELERDASIEVIVGSDVSYYNTLEEALAETTAGTIQLRKDVTAGTVDLKDNTLNLNGYILTANNVSGKVMDSQNGTGLIKLANAKSAQLTSSSQLILWDSTDSGYRVFDYTLESKGINAKGEDTNNDKSFWSELCFENRDAYALIAKGDSGLKVGFDVSWTPNGGTATSQSVELDSSIVAQWGDAESDDTENANKYYFYISITGFKNLKESGTLKVTPIVQDIFDNTATAEGMEYDYEHISQDALEILEFEPGYGALPEELA